MLLFLVNIIGCAQAGGVNPPLFSGARLSYHTWLPNLIIYLTLKYPDLVAIVRKMHILPPQANPATDENTAARERFFRLDLQLYGAVLACMPQHLILSLTNMNTNSGLEVLARLASEFGISGASDRSEAINMVLMKVTSQILPSRRFACCERNMTTCSWEINLLPKLEGNLTTTIL